MRLGLDVYSVRFQDWDAFHMLDYAAGLGLEVVHYSERQMLASHDPGYLGELRAHAAHHGLGIELGMGSIDRFAASFNHELGSGAEQLAAMCHAAAAVGSPVVRCYLGAQSDRLGPVPISEHIAECLRTLAEVAPVARDLRIKIAVENHGLGDLLADELRELVAQAGQDFVGVTLDTGNPIFAAEDPAYSAEVLGQYVATTQVRDALVWEHPSGAEGQWTVLGGGVVDLPAIMGTLERHCPDVTVNLEIITAMPPLPIPYLEPLSDFWGAYPDMPARALARFIQLARRGTRMGAAPLSQLTNPFAQDTPADVRARLVAQQREHLEASVRYARESLGLGRPLANG